MAEIGFCILFEETICQINNTWSLLSDLFFSIHQPFRCEFMKPKMMYYYQSFIYLAFAGTTTGSAGVSSGPGNSSPG